MAELEEVKVASEHLSNTNYRFFVGGNDLEMSEIKHLLADKGVNVADNNLGWGAKASAYSDQITEAIQKGEVPVLIELEPDVELPKDANVIVVDHHGKRASEPASILQVCKLLDIEPTRRIQLVAANDSGWIPGLRKFGATDDEIRNIRAEDRKAQGFDEALEVQSAELAAKAQIIPGLNLAITADLPISRFAGIKDRIAAEKGMYNIICIAKPSQNDQKGEMEFQGDGEICTELSKQFQGWSGGDGLGKKGGVAFWGGYPDDPKKVVDQINMLLRLTFDKGKSTNPRAQVREAFENHADVLKIAEMIKTAKYSDQISLVEGFIYNPTDAMRPISTRYRGYIEDEAPTFVTRAIKRLKDENWNQSQFLTVWKYAAPGILLKDDY